MRILIVINGWVTEIGGAEKHIFEVTQYWKYGNEICFLLPISGYDHAKDLRYQEKSLVGEAYVYSTPLEHERSGSFKLVLLWILRILRTLFLPITGKFDVIVASSHLTSNIVPAVFLKKKKAAKMVVYVYHLVSPKENAKSFFEALSFVRERIDLWLVQRYADVVFVENTLVRNNLIGLGFNKNRIFLTCDGVDLEFIDNVSVDRKDTAYDACFTGRLVRSKGIFDLISIWSNICKERPNSKLAIIGSGPELENLRKKVKALSLKKKVEMLGFVPEEEKIRVMKASKVFMFPSYEEGWPLAICEALACGNAVVAYDLPVYKEILDKAIKTVPVGNVEIFCKATLEILRDEQIRERMIADGHELCRKYTWEGASRNEMRILSLTINASNTKLGSK